MVLFPKLHQVVAMHSGRVVQLFSRYSWSPEKNLHTKHPPFPSTYWIASTGLFPSFIANTRAFVMPVAILGRPAVMLRFPAFSTRFLRIRAPGRWTPFGQCCHFPAVVRKSYFKICIHTSELYFDYIACETLQNGVFGCLPFPL